METSFFLPCFDRLTCRSQFGFSPFKGYPSPTVCSFFDFSFCLESTPILIEILLAAFFLLRIPPPFPRRTGRVSGERPFDLLPFNFRGGFLTPGAPIGSPTFPPFQTRDRRFFFETCYAHFPFRYGAPYAMAARTCWCFPVAFFFLR